jgi:hypothetical protein
MATLVLAGPSEGQDHLYSTNLIVGCRGDLLEAVEPRLFNLEVHSKFREALDQVTPAVGQTFSELLREESGVPRVVVTEPGSADRTPGLVSKGIAAGMNGEMSHATNKEKPKRIKQPTRKMWLAWRLSVAEGIRPQGEVARKLIEEGFYATQGQVSRWVGKVRDYLAAGDPLPPFHELNGKPMSIDPAKLDMGERQDGRTPRQRPRRDPDSDDE